MDPRTTRKLLAGGFAVALTAIGATALAQQDKGKGRAAASLRVAVVDIGLLFKSYKRKDDFETHINERRERIKKDLDEEQKRLVAIRQEMNQFREGSDPWLRAREKLEMAQFSLELKGKRLQAELKSKVEQRTLQILNEIEQTIGSFGKKYGFDLILKIDKAERVKLPGSGELVEHFQERIFRAQISDVLYYNGDKLDITRNVLTVLNSKENLEAMAELAAKAERERAVSAAPAEDGGEAKRETPK